MLVLTRKSGESLIIGDDVVITVVEIRGGQVKIGVEAPNSITIYRKELFEKIKQENMNAVNTEGNRIVALARHFTEKK